MVRAPFGPETCCCKRVVPQAARVDLRSATGGQHGEVCGKFRSSRAASRDLCVHDGVLPGVPLGRKLGELVQAVHRSLRSLLPQEGHRPREVRTRRDGRPLRPSVRRPRSSYFVHLPLPRVGGGDRAGGRGAGRGAAGPGRARVMGPGGKRGHGEGGRRTSFVWQRRVFFVRNGADFCGRSSRRSAR